MGLSANEVSGNRGSTRRFTHRLVHRLRYLPTTSLHSRSLGIIVLFHGTGSTHKNKRRSKALWRYGKWTWRCSSIHFFTISAPFCNIVSIQDSVINIHNKTQTTYAKINCALKDSSCDSPITMIRMLTILASNASSSTTIVFKCPHTKNDFVFIPWFHILMFWNHMQRSFSQERT
ncbi:hypothetical protein H5410_040799 [Solanum commersonii]|uniref:Uncharacterized protein n=1 Tax=Solanum commersonii TaxID=4109 RepID=A0A9J5XR68_SOLCO|nr:hypothetical protein H5410_040799 [Solanum commersonii]